MAKSTVKGGKLRHMPKPNGATAAPQASEPPPPPPIAEPPTPFDEPAASQPAPEPTAAPAVAKRGRRYEKVLNTNAARTILQIIQDVPAEYWGAGIASVKVYRLAPKIDRQATSEHKFIAEFTEPLDETRLLNEVGSGKYRLYLNYRNQAGGGTRETARGELDLMNPHYPPKIPAGEWLDDPKNKPWAWARPKEPPAQQAASSLGDVVEVIRATNEMRKEIREELTPANPTPAPAAPPAQSAPSLDPWAAAEKILNMRSDNPMVTILQGQLDALRHSLDEERKERITLQEKMWEAKLAALEAKFQGQQTAPAKSFIDQLTEFEAAKTKLQSLLGIGVDGAAAPRSRMSGTMEFWKDLVTEVLNAPVLNGVGQMLLSRFMQGAPGAGPGVNPAQPGVAQSPAVNLIQWVQGTLMEPIVRFLNGNSDGGDFADYVFEGWPDKLVPLQRMTHPQMPGQQGAPVIIELFKHSDIWQTQLAYRETQFRQFVQQFCEWRPEGEEGEAPPPAAQPINVPQDRSKEQPIDLDSEEAGKGEEVRP